MTAGRAVAVGPKPKLFKDRGSWVCAVVKHGQMALGRGDTAAEAFVDMQRDRARIPAGMFDKLFGPR